MHVAEEAANSVAAGVPLQVVIKLWPRKSSLDTTELQAELLCLFRYAVFLLLAWSHHSGWHDSQIPALHACALTLYPFTSLVNVTYGSTLVIACTGER